LFKNKKINIFYLLTGYVWFLFYKLQIIKSPKKAIEFLVNFFKGWKEKDLESLVDYFFDEYIEGNLFNQAIDEVKEHIKNGHKVVLISTSLEPIVKKIGLFMGVKEYISTDLEVMDGKYTGKIRGRVVDGQEKVNRFKKYLEGYGDKCDNLCTFFYTDHYSDKELLLLVDRPYVVNPDNILYKVARNNNWPIINYK
jgi:HAD superfamily hydrolase (TIGR01490 family)